MKFVLQTNSVSAHQLPLAREIVARIGAENFRYVCTGEGLQGGAQEVSANEPWIVRSSGWLEDCDVLLSGIRDVALFERRVEKGLMTFYQSERWFKPIPFFPTAFRKCLPGWVRLFVPRYFRMARRLAKLLANQKFRYLPYGPWAARDMRLMLRACGGGNADFPSWGYFVEPSSICAPSSLRRPETASPLRLLWVGRMLDWKRADTIVRAAAAASNRERLVLTLVGDGPEKLRLQELADALGCSSPSSVRFLSPVGIAEVRRLMREHDVYVLSSDAREGWGAVVNEALAEDMTVLGTYEAGSSAALLPKENLFHAGDWRALAKMLVAGSYRRCSLPRAYTPTGAADRLLNSENWYNTRHG